MISWRRKRLLVSGLVVVAVGCGAWALLGRPLLSKAGGTQTEPATPSQPSAPPPARLPAPPSNGSEPAGEIFGVPVPLSNYVFAKRVAYMFPQPWGAADLPESERERIIWESLIFSYGAFQRNIQAPEDEVDEMINSLLKDSQKPFTRHSDPEAYRRWAVETLYEDIPLFENQIRYVIQIHAFKDQVLKEQRVLVSEDDLRATFLNERHHVGGEMVTFKTKAEAQAFYERVKDPAQWEAMKQSGEQKIRPVALMTVEAYIDLWSIPQEQMLAFHALPIGSIGPPMPFGKEWCVYHLLEKRTGDLAEFPAQRENYVKRVELKKKAEASKQSLEQFVRSASLRVLVH